MLLFHRHIWWFSLHWLVVMPCTLPNILQDLFAFSGASPLLTFATNPFVYNLYKLSTILFISLVGTCSLIMFNKWYCHFVWIISKGRYPNSFHSFLSSFIPPLVKVYASGDYSVLIFHGFAAPLSCLFSLSFLLLFLLLLPHICSLYALIQTIFSRYVYTYKYFS